MYKHNKREEGGEGEGGKSLLITDNSKVNMTAQVATNKFSV